MESQPGQTRKLVSSWKEIAAHFGVTVRTAQIWESERGLPVHRMPGVKGRVYAYFDELEAWAKRESAQAATPTAAAEYPTFPPAPRRPKRLLWLIALLLLAVAALAAALWLNRPASIPSAYEINGRSLIIKSVGGEILWRHA